MKKWGRTNKITNAARLHSLVKKFGPFHPHKDGGELVFKCPNCHRWKLSYNPEKNIFHPCFRCTWSVRFPRAVKRAVKFLVTEKKKEDVPIEMPKLEEIRGWKVFKYLGERGVWREDVLRDGWQMWGNRIFIPLKEHGVLMSWVARSVDGNLPKELSGPNRSHFLYGYDDLKGTGDCIVLVEGIFDQIKVKSSGYACLALMGSSISDIQIGKILRLCPYKIILMMDGDEAGRDATQAIYLKLSKRMNPYSIHQIYLPDGKDPDDLSREEICKLIETAR